MILKSKKILVRIKEDHVSAYASQMAYFVVLSFIPFVLFLTTIVRYTPLTYTVVREAILGVVPKSLHGIVLSVIAEIYGRGNAVLPISVFASLWTAGKGIQAMIRGMNTIYHVGETRNWLMNRIYSVLYMILFVAAIIISLLLLVLGKQLQTIFLRYIPIIGNLIEIIIETRILIVFSVLFLVFLMLYKYLPNRKTTLKCQVPGAAFTAATWMIFSFGVSVYFSYSSGLSKMYGSMGALIMVMLWLYFCMYLTLLGAEINVCFEKYINSNTQEL